MLSHLDLFSGIGGFSLGLESAGLVKTVAFCDYEKFCQKVLNKHWPHVPIYGDVKELTHERLKADGINSIDIITGGYPCQPFSVAGSQKGEQDPRHVWPEMFRLIQELRPSFVIGENVSGHIKLGLDTVLENLESEGYSTRTFSISAASVGANHKRERVWTLAYSNDKGIRARFGRSNYDYEKKGRVWSFDRRGSESDDEWSNSSTTETEALDVADTQSEGRRKPGHSNKEKRSTESSATQSQSSSSNVADSNSERLQRTKQSGAHKEKTQTQFSAAQSFETKGDFWEFEPDVGRVAHGVSQRVDRLKGLGNAVVPQIPFLIGLAIREMIENE